MNFLDYSLLNLYQFQGIRQCQSKISAVVTRSRASQKCCTCCAAYRETTSKELLSRFAGKLGIKSAATSCTIWKARETVAASWPGGTASKSRNTTSHPVVKRSPAAQIFHSEECLCTARTQPQTHMHLNLLSASEL